jgi:hypothetical protein
MTVNWLAGWREKCFKEQLLVSAASKVNRTISQLLHWNVHTGVGSQEVITLRILNSSARSFILFFQYNWRLILAYALYRRIKTIAITETNVPQRYTWQHCTPYVSVLLHLPLLPSEPILQTLQQRVTRDLQLM